MKVFSFIVYAVSFLCAGAMVAGIWLSPSPPDRVFMTVWAGISILWLSAAAINEWRLNR